MRKIGIIHSLYVGFGALISLMIIITAIALFKVAVIDRTLSNVNDNIALKQRQAIDFRGSVHDRAIAIRDVVLAPTPSERNSHIRTIEKLREDYKHAATKMDNIFAKPEDVTAEEIRLYNNIKAIEAQAAKYTAETLSLAQNNKRDLAEASLVQKTSQAYTDWLAAINAFINYEEAESQHQVSYVRSSTSSLLVIMIIAAIASIVVGLCIGLSVINKLKAIIGGSPEDAVIMIKDFAQGDLTVRSDTTKNNSILGAINIMAEQLSSIIRNIGDLSSKLTSSSHSLSNLAGANTNLTTQQKDETQKGAHGIENIISGVSNVATLASNAVQASDSANNETQNGDEEVRKTIEYINNLAKQVDQVSEIIIKLDEDSQQIGSVVQIIAEIAEQTNLLALNAAIEAARAGEHGRGFAVVADEVRALAGRTKESTNGIIKLIESNQAHSRRAVDAMAESREQANLSVEQAQKAGDSLASIRDSVAQINDMNAHIASAAQDQTSILQEVNVNFSQITHMAEQALDASHDMASLSQELSLQANNLEKIVNSFKVQ